MPIQPSKRRRGFTLTEMLVVIGIIALVASITLVVLGKARKSATQSQLAFQLQTLSVGLDAYQTDFNSYPLTTINPVTTPNTAPTFYVNQPGVSGARTLCKALMGPQGAANPPPAGVGGSYPVAAHQDGKSGLGFAVPGRSGITVTADAEGNLKGKSYGPYLAADKFQMSNTDVAGNLVTTSILATEKYDDTAVLLDGSGRPILYYPALNPQAPVQLQYAYLSRGRTKADTISPQEAYPTPAGGGGYVGRPMFESTDNGTWLATPTLRRVLGDVRDAQRTIDTATNLPASDGAYNPAAATPAALEAEVPAIRGKYILYSAGPDGIFGINELDTRKTLAQQVQTLDDVTNFQGQ